MKDTQTHELRALLLASLMVFSVVGGSAAFAGSVGADGEYGLEATDGDGGQMSFLLENHDQQLAEGEESGDDTLQVEATDESLPTGEFDVALELPDSTETSFSLENSRNDVEIVVFGDGFSLDPEDDDAARDISIEENRLEFTVDFDDGMFSGEPQGIRVRSLLFDGSDLGEVDLQWTVDGETTEYTLSVEPFDGDIEVTDGLGSNGVVTAGAADREFTGTPDATQEPSSTLVLEGDPEAFPGNFETTLTLGDNGISFSEDAAEDAEVSSPANANEEGDPTSGWSQITIERESDTELVIEVINFEPEDSLLGEENHILEIEGLTLDAASDATVDDIEWEVFEERDTYRLTPARLATEFDDPDELPRGGAQTPADGTTVVIGDGDMIRASGGFHAEGEEMRLEIPEGSSAFSFDRSAEPEATIEGDLSTPTTVDSDEFRINDEVIAFDVPEEIDNEETVTIEGIRFNVTGADETAGEALTASSGLEVAYTPDPDNRFNDVVVATETAGLTADVPAVELHGDAPTTIEAGEGDQTGDSSIGLEIADTTGGQMVADTEIVVGLEESAGIQFAGSMTADDLVAETADDQSLAAEVASVESDTVRLEITASSEQGDSITLTHSDGDGLVFDVRDDSEGDTSAFTVETDAGNEPVIQVTGTAVEVEDGDDSDDSDDGNGDDGNGDDGNGDDGNGDDGNGDDGSGDDGDEAEDGDADNGDETDEGDADDTDDEESSAGGGGGGAAPAESPEFKILSADINETSITVHETVAVNVTVENVGDADGEFTARLTSDGFSLASETVDIEAGETAEVTLVNSFGEDGTFDLMVNDDVELATLSVEAVAMAGSETTEIPDATPGNDGTIVDLSEVPVGTITFWGPTNAGTLTIEELSGVPAGLAPPDGEVMKMIRVTVPESERDTPATLEFEIEADALEEAGFDSDDLTVVRYNATDDTWDHLETDVEQEGETLSVAGETPGFSVFGVIAQDETERTPTQTPATTESPTETPQTTPTPTESRDGDDERAGFTGSSLTITLGLVAVIALLLAAAGARTIRR